MINYTLPLLILPLFCGVYFPLYISVHGTPIQSVLASPRLPCRMVAEGDALGQVISSLEADFFNASTFFYKQVVTDSPDVKSPKLHTKISQPVFKSLVLILLIFIKVSIYMFFILLLCAGNVVLLHLYLFYSIVITHISLQQNFSLIILNLFLIHGMHLNVLFF